MTDSKLEMCQKTWSYSDGRTDRPTGASPFQVIQKK